MAAISEQRSDADAGGAEERPPALLLRGRVGASMLELLMVLSLVGVMAAVCVPRLAGAQARHQEENRARAVERALAHARSEARRRSVDVRVRFNGQDEVIDLVADPDGAAVSLPWRGDVAGTRADRDVTLAWLVVVDAHGGVELTGVPAAEAVGEAVEDVVLRGAKGGEGGDEEAKDEEGGGAEEEKGGGA
ncbi:MAG: pilus assembly FimT family protein [Phycisphaerales bacterium]